MGAIRSVDVTNEIRTGGIALGDRNGAVGCVHDGRERSCEEELMSKELWIAAHEQLIEEYLDEHPDAEWDEAYHKTADFASDRMADNFAHMIDSARDRAKYAKTS